MLASYQMGDATGANNNATINTVRRGEERIDFLYEKEGVSLLSRLLTVALIDIGGNTSP
jgi:hypothetical protein